MHSGDLSIEMLNRLWLLSPLHNASEACLFSFASYLFVFLIELLFLFPLIVPIRKIIEYERHTILSPSQVDLCTIISNAASDGYMMRPFCVMQLAMSLNWSLATAFNC